MIFTILSTANDQLSWSFEDKGFDYLLIYKKAQLKDTVDN